MSLPVRRLLATVSLAACALSAAACEQLVAEPIVQESGGVGDPCVPSEEERASFGSFPIEENYLKTAFDHCASGVCLVNHFQGRVTCPLGQPAPTPCAGSGDTSCGEGRACVEVATVPVYCDPGAQDGGASSCVGHGTSCNPNKGACDCSDDAHCPAGTACDLATHDCKRYVCHTPGACQSAGATDAENEGKACCLPGTDTPVSVSVCGQCAETSRRDAESAVYCSCKCGPAEGAPEEPGAEYCTCPDGFECSEIRPYLGIGSASSTGKFCIKAGTDYTSHSTCGEVTGYSASPMCGD